MKKMEKNKIPTSVRKKILTEMYAGHSVVEIAKRLGCKPDGLYKMAKRLGLRHSDETLNRIKKKQAENLKMGYEKESIRKRTETMTRLIRMERFRVMSGDRQRTRIRVVRMPRKAYHAKHNLIYRHGYFAFKGDSYVVGYDKDTKRVNEEYYKRKYGLKFEEDPLCQEV